MHIRMIAAFVAVFAGCGSTGLSEDQNTIVGMLVENSEAVGYDYRQGCVEDIVSQYSDEDARALVLGDNEIRIVISDDTRELITQLPDCIVLETWIDVLVDAQVNEDSSVDGDCLRKELENATDLEDATRLSDEARPSCMPG